MKKQKKEDNSVFSGFFQNAKDMYKEGSKPINFFGLENNQQRENIAESKAEEKLKRIMEILRE